MYLTYTSRRHLPLRVRKLIDHLAGALAGMIDSEDALPLATVQRVGAVQECAAA
jgi:hypothetical protein